MTFCFTDGKIVRDHRIVEEDLWISEGKIIPPQIKADKEISLEGCLIAPGYIDLQINGAFGVDFTSSLEGIEKAASRLPQYGVTAFLPTIISTIPKKYDALIPNFRPCLGAIPLGLHLEGPFLNPEYAGAHTKDYLQSFPKSSKEIYGTLSNVKVVTLAPELPGAFESIQELSSQGIIVAAGHTGASYELMEQAIKRGVRLVTHLFNAMIPFYPRAPGVIGAALTQPDLYYTVIVDGIHMHPAALKLAWQSHPDGMILVSDAIAALGMGEGIFHLGEKDIEIKVDKAVIQGTETLAGSTLSMDRAVRNLCQVTGCSIVEAVEAASLRPAQLLGLKNKGHLEYGADADFNILDEAYHVKACYIGGSQSK